MACAKSNPLALWLVAAVMAAGTPALAQTYKWIDEKGHVQYTDRLPPEAVNRGIVELNKQGMTSKVTAPPLTPEQRKAQAEREDQMRQAERALAEQRRQDSALVASYTSENDIEMAKRRNLALVGSNVLSSEARIKTLTRRSAVLEQDKLFYENKPVPEKLQRELANNAVEISKQQALIAQRNEDALVIINKYDALKLRFREIKPRMAHETATAPKQ